MKGQGEVVRVGLLSLLLAGLLQIPISAFYYSVSTHPPGSLGSLKHIEQKTDAVSQGEPVNCQPERRRVALTQQHKYQPTSTPHYAFVKFSSYRLSLRTFYVVGISSAVVRERDKGQVVHTCEWHPNLNGSQPMMVHSVASNFMQTDANMIYIGFDENGMTYVPAIVNCTFGEDVGADGQGGLLVIRVSLTYHRYEKNTMVIALEENIGDIKAVKNPPGEVNWSHQPAVHDSLTVYMLANVDPLNPNLATSSTLEATWLHGCETFELISTSLTEQKPYKYAFCGPPMHGTVQADWVKMWLTYHNYIWEGKAHFFFYNVGGLKDADRLAFQVFLDEGLLTITDLTDPRLQDDFPMWYFHQLLYINDCLHRSRFLADHVFYFDFDEFLQIRAPETIHSLIQRNKEAPWITFGNIPADIEHCQPQSEADEPKFPVERMLWHDKKPECMHDDEDPWTCLAAIGRRKYCANTERMLVGGVHRAAIPYEGGINMNASQARVLHFRGALSPSKRLCNNVVEKKDYNSLSHMESDDYVSLMFGQAKKFPIKRRLAL